jgi:hypothetical protein
MFNNNSSNNKQSGHQQGQQLENIRDASSEILYNALRSDSSSSSLTKSLASELLTKQGNLANLAKAITDSSDDKNKNSSSLSLSLISGLGHRRLSALQSCFTESFFGKTTTTR